MFFYLTMFVSYLGSVINDWGKKRSASLYIQIISFMLKYFFKFPKTWVMICVAGFNLIKYTYFNKKK